MLNAMYLGICRIWRIYSSREGGNVIHCNIEHGLQRRHAGKMKNWDEMLNSMLLTHCIRKNKMVKLH